MNASSTELAFGVDIVPRGTAAVVVSVRGDVDMSVASRLETALRTAAANGATNVVVDLAEATFFDSSAIHALLVGSSFAHERNAQVQVVCDEPAILRVLQLAGVDKLLPLHETVAGADGPRAA